MKRLAILFAVGMALGGGSFAPADERQTWDLGTLLAGRVYPTTATAANVSCPGRHDFQITIQNTPWFRLTGPAVLRRIGVGEEKTTPAEVDTRGLAPGDYRGLMKIRCLDCPPPPRCVQDVTELEILLHIPSEEERFDPVPGGSLEETDERCGVLEVEGRFEPTQGVWQDDPVFPDRETKQLRQLNPRLFEAELPMVKTRGTTVFGTIRPVGGAPESRRDEIFLRGKADGSRPVPVKIRVTAIDGAGAREIWTSESPVEIPIGKPCHPGSTSDFEVAANVGTGAGDFTLDTPGEYVLEAELVRTDGSGTGIRARVFGRVVETRAPRILFRPVTVLPVEHDVADGLHETTRDLERRSAQELPDWFPLQWASLVTRTLEVRDYTPALTDRETIERITSRFRPADPGERSRLILREALNRELQTAAVMEGFDRVIATLTFDQFNLLRTGEVRRAVAFTNSPKVSFLDVGTAPFTYTVAHELSHTLPFPWTTRQVAAECGVDYHDKVQGRQAHGVRLTLAGDPQRSLQTAVIPLFAQATRAVPWITQCTYWHHLNTLVEGPPDPPVILVQGYAGREGEVAGAGLLPAYQLDGIVDLAAGEGGEWAIELEDGGGAALGRYPFEPAWVFPDSDESKPVVAFVHRLPDLPGVAAIRVVGPGGAEDRLIYSANAPTVEITSPRKRRAKVEDGRVTVEWRGADRDGDTLLYTVLYSDDGGATWVDFALETEETSAELVVREGSESATVRVLVTDGARSGEARLDLSF